ncbi:MAG: sigma-70 family RNA polymerase sigma factor [Maioricimonas sp. JB049]
MAAAKRRYAPTDAKRPNLVAQAEGASAVVDLAVQATRHLGIRINAETLLVGICDQLDTVQAGDTIGTHVVKAAAETAASHIGREIRRLDHAGDPQTELQTAPSETSSNENRSTDVIRRRLTGGLRRLSDPSVLRLWETAFSEPSGTGNIASWVEKAVATGRFGIEASDRLAWALIRAESLNHVGLTWTVANRMARSRREATPEDLFGWGWQGLCSALKSYDPDTAAFSTYAVRRINGAILDGIRSENHLPKRLVSLVSRANAADEELTKELGREPRLEELAAEVDATLLEMELAMTRYEQPSSLNEITANGDGTPHDWAIPAEYATEDAAIETLQSEAIVATIDTLEATQRDVIRLVVFEGESLRSAAEQLKLSTREVKQARDAGLAKLREALRPWRPVP